MAPFSPPYQRTIMDITNTSTSPQGVHTTKGIVYIAPGKKKSVELTEDGVKLAERLTFLKMGGGWDKNSLRTDGPTIAEYIAAGYPATNYPPHGYSAVSSADEIAAAIAATAAPSDLVSADDRDALKLMADSMGIEYRKNIPTEDLRALIAEKTVV